MHPSVLRTNVCITTFTEIFDRIFSFTVTTRRRHASNDSYFYKFFSATKCECPCRRIFVILCHEIALLPVLLLPVLHYHYHYYGNITRLLYTVAIVTFVVTRFRILKYDVRHASCRAFCPLPLCWISTFKYECVCVCVCVWERAKVLFLVLMFKTCVKYYLCSGR